MADSPTQGDHLRSTPPEPGSAEQPHPTASSGWEPPPWARTTAQAPWTGSWTDPRARGWNDPRAQWAGEPAPGYAAEPGSSPLAVIAATVLLLLGALVTLVALFMLVFGAVGAEFMEDVAFETGMPGGGAALATVIVVISVFALVLGILHMVSAIGVFTHKEWARWLGVALAALGLALGGLLALASIGDPTADAGSWIIVLVWLTAYVAALFGLIAGGEQFQPSARSRN